MANSSSGSNNVNEHKSEGQLNIQDVLINKEAHNVEMEVKVGGETGFSQKTDIGSQEELHIFVSENKEKPFYSQASDLGIEMARDCCALSPETYIVDESRQFDGASGTEQLIQTSTAPEEDRDSAKEISGNNLDSNVQVSAHQPPAHSAKGKKQKAKNTRGFDPASPSPGSFKSFDSNNGGVSSSNASMEAAVSQILSLHEKLNQHWTSIQELLKHFWSSYPKTTKYFYAKVTRLKDAMSQIYPKLQEIKESVQSDVRHQVSLLVQPMLLVNFYLEDTNTRVRECSHSRKIT